MYKLLVVDDEPRQVRSLANIISQLRPEYEIHTAYGGNEALELLMKSQFDIVFTDIRMPDMDGLQLIECLNRNGISVKTVILSGYGEFEYAQKAIRFGVDEYLVKPIGKGDIEQLLSKIEEALRNEKETKAQEEEMRQKLSSYLPVYLEHQLNRWVSGMLNEAERNEIKSLFPCLGRGVVLTVSFSKTDNAQDMLSEEFRRHADISMKEALKSIGHSISFFHESDRCQMITVLALNQHAGFRLTDSAHKLLQFIEKIECEFGYTAIIGVSVQTDNLFDGITQAFLSSQEAVERRFFSGQEKVIFSTAAANPATTAPYRIGELENRISEALRTGSKENISKITREIFGALKSGCGLRPRQIKEDMMYLLLNQSKILVNLISKDEYAALSNRIKQGTMQCEELSKLWHFTNEILYGIIEIIDKRLNDKNGILINDCKKYIDENYREDISLETVAQKYFFNPSYFSNLFKSYTGTGFSEYLLQVRIQNAEKLLKNTDDNIADIARKVGFKDPSYFNRVFKRETGISPLRFRQLSGKR